MADQRTVEALKNNVGNTGDTGGSATAGTAMGKLNDIIKCLGVSTNGSTIQEVLEELLAKPKVIKHIQRGYIGSRNENIVTVSLSGFGNINKMIAICNGYGINPSNNTRGDASVNALAVNSLKLTCHTYSGTKYDWSASYQVIEFC